MLRKVKLIWDFRGSDSEERARRHGHHLEEYLEGKKLGYRMTGMKTESEDFSYSYMIVEEDEMKSFRDALRPTRGGWIEL